jgi:hypothetical protein
MTKVPTLQMRNAKAPFERPMIIGAGLVQPGESSSPVPNGVAPLHTRKTPPPNWRGNCGTQY